MFHGVALPRFDRQDDVGKAATWRVPSNSALILRNTHPKCDKRSLTVPRNRWMDAHEIQAEVAAKNDENVA
jgi:hypothetical protein